MRIEDARYFPKNPCELPNRSMPDCSGQNGLNNLTVASAGSATGVVVILNERQQVKNLMIKLPKAGEKMIGAHFYEEPNFLFGFCQNRCLL